MRRRTWAQRLVLLFNLAAITAALGTAGLLRYATVRAAAVNRVALDRSLTEVEMTDSGARVINILLVGSDSSANLDEDDPIQVGRRGERFGDVIIIAHIDERSGEVALMSLPRDLWIPIAGTERANRINRAFLVGGPALLIDTIEDAFDIPIHHYVNVDFAGFQGLVEAVGSVDVYFETPARDWNVNADPEPRSQTGFIVTEPGCHALDPEQALAYVRSRYYQVQDDDGRWVTDPTSDLGRIARQQDFLGRLLQEAIDQGARNPLVLASLIDTGIQNVAIDQELTPALLLSLSETYRSFEPGDLQTYTFPVVDDTIGPNRVLVPRDDDAQPLLALFGGARFDSPATIGLSVLYADPSDDDGSGADATADADADDGATDGPDPADLAELASGADTIGGDEEGPLGPSPAGRSSQRSTPRGDGLDEVLGGLQAAGYDPEASSSETIGAGLVVRHGSSGAAAARVVADALLDAGLLAVTEEVDGLDGRNVVVAVGADVVVDTSSVSFEPGSAADPSGEGEPTDGEGALDVVTPSTPPADGPSLHPSGADPTVGGAADRRAGSAADHRTGRRSGHRAEFGWRAGARGRAGRRRRGRPPGHAGPRRPSGVVDRTGPAGLARAERVWIGPAQRASGDARGLGSIAPLMLVEGGTSPCFTSVAGNLESTGRAALGPGLTEQ